MPPLEKLALDKLESKRQTLRTCESRVAKAQQRIYDLQNKATGPWDKPLVYQMVKALQAFEQAKQNAQGARTQLAQIEQIMRSDEYKAHMQAKQPTTVLYPIAE